MAGICQLYIPRYRSGLSLRTKVITSAVSASSCASIRASRSGMDGVRSTYCE